MPSGAELLGACTVLLATSVWLIRRRLYPKPIPGIPHNPITSFLGDIPTLGETMKNGILSDFLHKCADEHGPIFQVLLGPASLVCIADPYEIEDIQLRGRSKLLDAADKSTGLFGGITPNGQVALTMNDLWKKHRRIGGPFMSGRYLKQMTPRIADEALSLVLYWKDKMNVVRKAGANCFDCQFDLQLCTMDAITEVAFGERHNGIQRAHSSISTAAIDIDAYGGATFPTITGTKFHKAVVGHMQRFVDIMSVPPFLWKIYWFFVKRTRSYRDDDKAMRDVIRTRIEQAVARAANVRSTGITEAPDSALDMIVEKDQHDKAAPYTTVQLEDEMMDYVFAGYDTTASAIAYGVKFLMNHPAVQRKLHDELTANLTEPSNRALTYDEVATGEKTPYLEAVVHELLRVALIGAGNNREAQEDMVVLGRVIPKGTEVLLLTGYAGLNATKSWGARRAAEASSFQPSKGFWDDDNAQQFVPERWLVDGPDGKKIFSITQGYSIPFGLGAKSCFGQKLAVLEIKIILATINLGFFLDAVPEELNGDKPYDFVTRKPTQAYLSLVEWEDMKLK